jgi:hypothetical protein
MTHDPFFLPLPFGFGCESNKAAYCGSRVFYGMVSRIQWDWCDITRLDIDKVLEKIALAEKIRVSFDSIGNLKWN